LFCCAILPPTPKKCIFRVPDFLKTRCFQIDFLYPGKWQSQSLCLQMQIHLRLLRKNCMCCAVSCHWKNGIWIQGNTCLGLTSMYLRSILGLGSLQGMTVYFL
jgi:hypothetical protein